MNVEEVCDMEDDRFRRLGAAFLVVVVGLGMDTELLRHPNLGHAFRPPKFSDRSFHGRNSE
jgi:hypothetical protein